MTRCGYVAIIGAPNAGKSTLMNALVGSKLSIVTPKVQTTRSRVIGVCVEGESQIIFVDTPGIFAANQKFEKAMVASAWAGVSDADVVMLLVDAKRGNCVDTVAILEKLKTLQKPFILVMNKTDLVEKPMLLEFSKMLHERVDFTASFMISALKNRGVDDIRAYLLPRMPESPFHYPEDQLTDIPERQLAAEITREKLFMRLSQEIPYSIAVETEAWEEKKDGSVKISQVIHVQKEGQKKIVIGNSGAALKAIGAGARKEMAVVFDRTVHLFLFVRVSEDWKDKPEMYKAIGLEYK